MVVIVLLPGTILLAEARPILAEARPLPAEVLSLSERLQQAAPIVCAHRGRLDGARPENSLLEMQQTLAAGITMMEIDLSESSDGTMFLLHDRTLERTTDGIGTTQSHTAAELRRVHLKKPDGNVTAEPLVEFDAVLRWAHGSGAYLMLDIKQTPPAHVARLVSRRGMEKQVLLLTFDHATTEEAVGVRPALPVSVLVKSKGDMDVVRRAGSGPGTGLALGPGADTNQWMLFYVAGTTPDSIAEEAACAGPVVTDSMGGFDDEAAKLGGGAYTRLLEDRPIGILVTNNPLLAQRFRPATPRHAACGGG